MFVKQSNYLDQSMKNVIHSNEFQNKFEFTKISSYEPNIKTAILQLIELSDKIEKLGGVQASQKLLKIANEALEICGICGYDHEYDGAYPGVKESIQAAHKEDFELPFDDSDEVEEFDEFSIYDDDDDKKSKDKEYDPVIDDFLNDCGDMSTLDGASSVNDGEENEDL